MPLLLPLEHADDAPLLTTSRHPDGWLFPLPPMSRVAPRVVFVFFLIINCILWSRSKYGRTYQLVHDDSAGLVRRMPSHPDRYQVQVTSEEEV